MDQIGHRNGVDAWLLVRRTLTLTGRGERMRADGPVERVVGQPPVRVVSASSLADGEDA
jgi:hypothetical protein